MKSRNNNICLIMEIVSCKAREEIEQYMDSYIEQLKKIEDKPTIKARISEAETIKNNAGGMLLGNMIVLVAKESEYIYGGLMSTKQSKEVLNIDHITAYNGNGASLMYNIINIAEETGMKKITLVAAGEGNTFHSKVKSFEALVKFYSKFGFVQTAPPSGYMELQL